MALSTTTSSASPPLIPPTIGRKVHYYPNGPLQPGQQPWDATVVYVWGERLVNLRVTDPNGNSSGKTSVWLLQGDDPVPNTPHCAWMPYQQQMAEKAKLGQDVEINRDQLIEAVAKAAQQGFRS